MTPRRQFDSHGWAQMRAQMDASGLGARAMRYPRAVSHSATARTYPPAFVRTGQPLRQGIRSRKYLKSGTAAEYERMGIGSPIRQRARTKSTVAGVAASTV